MSTSDIAVPDWLSGLSAAELEAIRDGFGRSTLLSVVDAHEVQRLLSDARLIVLERGAYLFRQGDVSDSAYVAVSGVLSAILEGDAGQGQVVGSVRAGESVGEMGVLTSAPRSLSIVARTRSTLVRIEGESFLGVCLNHPKLLLKVVHIISARNRDTIRALSPFRPGQTTVIAPLHDGGLVEPFLQRFDVRLKASGHFDVVSAGDVMAGARTAPERPRVVTIGGSRSPSSDVTLEATDRVMLVADAGRADATLTETAARMLVSAGLPRGIEKDLVLLDDSAGPRATASWLDRARFARHHHVRPGHDADQQRLMRYLRGQSVAVVMSGGGVRGWVHLGALRALEERQVPIDGFVGSSIGAVVCACRLVNGTVDAATKSFARIARAIAKSKGVGSLTFPAVSILNGRRWTHAIKEEFGDRYIEDLPVPFCAVSCNLSRNEQVVHRRGKLWEAVRASSSLPALVPPFVSGGQLFVDGGIVNNAPVDVARTMMGGSCRTIAIELSGAGESDQREYRFPPILTFTDTLLAKLRLGNRDFRFISIGEIVFRSLTHGSMAKTNENLRGADIVLRPAFPNQGFLSTSNPDGLVELGYQSMLAELDASRDLPLS